MPTQIVNSELVDLLRPWFLTNAGEGGGGIDPGHFHSYLVEPTDSATHPVEADDDTNATVLGGLNVGTNWFDLRHYATLALAVVDIGVTPATLLVAVATIVAADLIIPTTLTLRCIRGGVITINNGIQLTINGPFEAGLYKVFNCVGTGAVVFGVQSALTIEAVWWQENTTPGTTDMHAALTAAIASTGTWHGVTIPIRSYAISDTVLLSNKSITLQGFGWGIASTNSPSFLKWIGTTAVPMLQVQDSRNTKLTDFRLIGNSAHKPTAAISIYQTAAAAPATPNWYNTYERLFIGKADWDAGEDYDEQFEKGIWINGAVTSWNDSNKFDMIKISGVQVGVQIDSLQSLMQHFSNLFIWYASEAAVKTAASLSGNNWFFGLNTVDIETTGNAPRIDIQSFNSESSGRMLLLGGSATVHIHSGYWQSRKGWWNDPPTNTLWMGLNPDLSFICGIGEWNNVVVLEDFDVTLHDINAVTPTIDLRESPGGGARKTLKIMGNSTGMPPRAIKMDAGALGTNERFIFYEQYSNGPANPMQFFTNHLGPSEVLHPDMSDVFGGHVRFPATQHASTDANVLDDYAEGPWTMQLAFGGVAQGTSVNGYYTKIGNLVTVSGYLPLISKGGVPAGGVGAAATLGVLPLLSANNNAASAPAALRLSKVTFANQFMGFVGGNSQSIYFEEVTEAGVVTALTWADFADASVIMVNVTYRAAA